MATTTFLGFSWYLWGSLCLIIAAIYTVLWPRAKQGVERSLWRHIVLRWFHALVWLLLALSCFLRPTALPGSRTISNVLAVLALLAYFTFMGTLMTDVRYQRPK